MARRLTAAALLLAALAAALLLAGQPARSSAAVPPGEIDPLTATDPIATHVQSFRTPSGRLACLYQTGYGPTLLVCELRNVKGDLTGMPKVDGAKITKFCKRDFASEWGGAVQLKATGKPQVLCPSGVQVPQQHPKVLAYGTRWSRGQWVCLSREDALRCSQQSGKHGFRYDKDLLRVW